MRLTIESDPETIKRYGHVKPARGWRTAGCSAHCPGTAHRCTLGQGHRGPHVAHRWFGKVVAVWDSGTGARASGESIRRASEARARRSLRTREEATGALSSLLSRVTHVVSSVEEVAFAVMFLAFVGFAVYWFLLIVG